MEFKTAAISSLLSILAVCLQVNSHVLLDPDTPIISKTPRGRSLYGIDEVIVPRIDSDEDVAHPLISEINPDAEIILEVEDININDGYGDNIEAVVDFPINEPAEDIVGVRGVLTDNVNVTFEPQDVGYISEEEDPSYVLYVIQLANLILAQELPDFGKVISVAPSFLTGYTATQTPAVLGVGNIYKPVNAIVYSMLPGATGMGAFRPALTTTGGTPQIYPWQQQFAASSVAFGAPLGYPKVQGPPMVVVPPVPPNANGPQQNYLQQQLNEASFSLFGPPAAYPQINGAIMPPIRPVPPLQFYEASYSPFGTPASYGQVNGAVKLSIPPVSPNAYGPQQSYQQQPLFEVPSPFGPVAGYSQMNAELQQSQQQQTLCETSSSLLGPMACYPRAVLQHPIPPLAPYEYGPQQSLQQQTLYGDSSSMLGTLSSLDMLVGYPEVSHVTEAAFPQEPLTALNVAQTYIQEQPYSVAPSLLHLMFDFPYDVSIDTVATSPPSPSTYDVPQTHLLQQQYGAPFPLIGIPPCYLQ